MPILAVYQQWLGESWYWVGLGWVEIRVPHRVRFSTLTVEILSRIVTGNFDMFPGATPLAMLSHRAITLARFIVWGGIGGGALPRARPRGV